MLRPAHVVDLPILRALIRDGASRGSFDRELATDSREATLFFSNLRQALDTGYFVEEDPRTGDLTTVAVPALRLSPRTRRRGQAKPIGFGLFKATRRRLRAVAHRCRRRVARPWPRSRDARCAPRDAARPARRTSCASTASASDSPAMAHLLGVVRLRLRPAKPAASRCVSAQRTRRPSSAAACAECRSPSGRAG